MLETETLLSVAPQQIRGISLSCTLARQALSGIGAAGKLGCLRFPVLAGESVTLSNLRQKCVLQPRYYELQSKMGKVPIRLREVVYTLSPFEQTVMNGVWKDVPEKLHRKFSEVRQLLEVVCNQHTPADAYDRALLEQSAGDLCSAELGGCWGFLHCSCSGHLCVSLKFCLLEGVAPGVDRWQLAT